MMSLTKIMDTDLKTNIYIYMCTHAHTHTYMYILDDPLSVFGDMVNQQK